MPLFLQLDNLIAIARVHRSTAEWPLENEPEWTANTGQGIEQPAGCFSESSNSGSFIHSRFKAFNQCPERIAELESWYGSDEKNLATLIKHR